MADVQGLTHQHLQEARTSPHGRSTELLVHDGVLRQSIIALRAGVELSEHNSPPAASMHVLLGRVRVTGSEPSELHAGEITALTHQRHAVTALEDTVFLLTTVTSVEQDLPGPQR